MHPQNGSDIPCIGWEWISQDNKSLQSCEAANLGLEQIFGQQLLALLGALYLTTPQVSSPEINPCLSVIWVLR